MADFKVSYEKLLKWEGWAYENVPGDLGGETYAGIARRFNPQWNGWKRIDELKQLRGNILNDPLLKNAVDEFYMEIYLHHKLDRITLQPIADQVFQAIINMGSIAISWMQRIASDLTGSNVTIDKVIGNQTLAAINMLPTVKEFTERFCTMQNSYYDSIIMRNPTQEKFRRGWHMRSNSFKVSA